MPHTQLERRTRIAAGPECSLRRSNLDLGLNCACTKVSATLKECAVATSPSYSLDWNGPRTVIPPMYARNIMAGDGLLI